MECLFFCQGAAAQQFTDGVVVGGELRNLSVMGKICPAVTDMCHLDGVTAHHSHDHSRRHLHVLGLAFSVFVDIVASLPQNGA